MTIGLPMLGTRLDLEIFSKTSFGPLTFQVLDVYAAPWPVGQNDEVRLWVKTGADAPDAQALVNKVVNWIDEPKGIFSVELSPAECDIAPRRYVHQFVLTSGGNEHVLVYGDFTVLERLPD